MACRECGKPVKNGHPACERRRRQRRARRVKKTARSVSNPRRELKLSFKAFKKGLGDKAADRLANGPVKRTRMPSGGRWVYRSERTQIKGTRKGVVVSRTQRDGTSVKETRSFNERGNGHAGSGRDGNAGHGQADGGGSDAGSGEGGES